MWKQHFPSKMTNTHLQWMSSCISCMMCLVAVSCQINLQSTSGVSGPGHHVYKMWIPVITSLGATLKTMHTTQTPTNHSGVASAHILCSGFASGEWSRCQRNHGWHCESQLTTLWFVYSKPMKSKNLTCTQILHESELSFMYHMFLHPTKLWIYHTRRLLCFFEYPVHCATIFQHKSYYQLGLITYSYTTTIPFIFHPPLYYLKPLPKSHNL
jgi:hypothetical protein